MVGANGIVAAFDCGNLIFFFFFFFFREWNLWDGF